ncbi:MAG TPA: tRNA modification GTPase [Tepidisphaeraceae bacterium]|nr:tRNA modification GTPase [Tepidisphaeraceae bacterium]
MTNGDTIAAISSATGPAQRMIVRASGPMVPQIHAKLTGTSGFEAGARHCPIIFNRLSVPAWVYSFTQPHSVTSEDVIELHIPGNPLLARMLLDELIRLGARQAEPGEFTARSYFNGKIGLSQAEGVAAVIAAHSDRELAAARQLMAGELARQLNPITDQLAQTLALVEAGIDFSEEDISFITRQQIAGHIDSADQSLNNLLANSSRFERLSHEPGIVLAGRPNAGKSTLLNALAGHERAVISPQAGTTRDALWALVRLPRGMVRMIDVAGIEDQGNDQEIARSMQQQAIRAIEEADLVVLVRDCMDIRQDIQLPRHPDLRVLTKIDLLSQAHASSHAIQISAKSGTGLEQLRHVLDTVAFGRLDRGAVLALNARHVQSIQDCRDALARAKAQSMPEIIAMELRHALDALGRVIGDISPDDVLGRVFAAFCIGK